MALIGVQEVQDYLGICDRYAYKVIRELNAELEQKGFRTVRGKIPEAYLRERYYKLGRLKKK